MGFFLFNAKYRRGVALFLVFLLISGLVPAVVLAAPAGRSTSLSFPSGFLGQSLASINPLSELDLTGASPTIEKRYETQQQLLAYASPPATVTQTTYSVTQSVYVAPPVLDPLPVITGNLHYVTGSAEPGSKVSLSMAQDGGTPEDQGYDFADSQGYFEISVFFPDEGTYLLTATAELNGGTSAPSEPVEAHVDGPPDRVRELRSLNETPDSIELQWDLPNNEDLDKFFVDRDGLLIGTVKASTADASSNRVTFTDSGLQPKTAYCYEITTVDKGGNQSGPERLCIGTTPVNKLVDFKPWEANGLERDVVLSRDGSTLVYTDEGTPEDTSDNVYVHVLDLPTGENQIISPPDSPYSYSPAASSDGKLIAFQSYHDDPSGKFSVADIYVYDRNTSTLTNITDNFNYDCESPSISADGKVIAYMCAGNELYVYDRQTGEVALITNPDSGYWGYELAVSGDGSAVAFVSYNVISNVEHYYLSIYDVASKNIVLIKDMNAKDMRGLSINNNGMFIAYSTLDGSYYGSRYHLHVYDRAQDKELNIDNPDDDSDYDYGEGSTISPDGRYVLASYKNWGMIPRLTAQAIKKSAGTVSISNFDEPGAPRKFGAALHEFDYQKGTGTIIREIGSPGLDTYYATMDGAAQKFVMQEGDALYMECTTGDCGTAPTAGPIDAVWWTAPSGMIIADELKPGATITIHASGRTGEQIQAKLAYTTASGADPIEESIPLSEESANSGRYSADFPIPDGTTAITALQAIDGSYQVSATQLVPIKVGGMLNISFNTAYPSGLEGTQIHITNDQIHNSEQWIDITGKNQVYTVAAGLHDGSDYKVYLIDRGEVIAVQDHISIANGQVTSIVLNPVFYAAITVHIAGVDQRYIPNVTFKKAGTDKVLGTLAASRDPYIDKFNYIAKSDQLKGVSLKAGDQIEVEVAASESSPYLSMPLSKTITLEPGYNDLTVTLLYQSNFIRYEEHSFTNFSRRFSMASLDSVMQMKLWSDPGKTVQAIVSYQERDDQGQIVDKTATVDLTEGSFDSGRKAAIYTADFPVKPGMVKIESYSVSLDGMAMPTPYGVNTSILGRLKVVVKSPLTQGTEKWSGLYLAVMANGGNYGYQELDGSPSYTLDLPGERAYTAAEDYYYTEMTRSNSVQLNSGETAQLTLEPVFPATLVGTAVDKNGKSAAWVDLALESSDGRILSRATSDANGGFRLTNARTGASVKIRASDNRLRYADVMKEITMALDSAETQVSLTMPDHSLGTVNGQIRDEDQRPVASAKITAVVQKNGYSQSISATSDQNGKYSLTLPTGDFAIHAAVNRYIYSETVTKKVDEGQNVKVDLPVVDHEAQIDVKIYTKYIGSQWQGPMGLDWRFNVHIGLSADHHVISNGNPLVVEAAPGDAVKVCVNGAQGDLPSACAETTIGDDRHGSVELRLEQGGGIAKAHVDGANNGVSGYFYRLNDQGSYVYAGYISQMSPDLKLALDSPGKYRLDLTDGRDNRLGASKDFAIAKGQTLELGHITLQPFGIFGGRAGNGIEVFPGTVSPGGIAEVRVSYANRGNADARNSSIRLTLPEGTSVVDGSMTVDGTAAEYIVQDGMISVAIGNGGVVKRGDSGTVDFRLSVQNVLFGGQQSITAKIHYTDSQGADTTEMLGTAGYQLVSVSLDAPLVTASLSLPLSGMAPAGSTVSVYDGNTMLGYADTSPAGLWKLDAWLPDTGDGSYHTLHAEADINAGKLVSDDHIVRYDTHMVRLTSVTMRQPDGREITFDPSQGVARFPYVYIGGGFLFTLKFSDPDRVENVRVYQGDGFAKAELKDGGFKAFVNPRHLGPIWVQYDVIPSLEDLPQPTRDTNTLRGRLPGAFQNFKVDSVTQPEAGQPAKMDITLSPELDMHAQVSVNFRMDNDYTPSAASTAAANEAGAPVYDLQVNPTFSDGKMIISFSAHVPMSALQEAGGTAKAGLDLFSQALAAGMQNRSVKKSEKVHTLGVIQWVEEAGEITFTIGSKAKSVQDLWNIFGNYDNLKSLLGNMKDPTFDNLSHLMDEADQVCDPELRQFYHDKLLEIGKWAMAFKLVAAGIDIAGVVFAPETFGLSLLAFGASKLIEYVMDKNIEKRSAVIRDGIEDALKHPDYYCDSPPPDGPPDADPVYILDPSGYIYEGIPSHRLSDVQATAMQWDSDSGTWKDWDATWFGQMNPLTTDPNGNYAWFVPDGKWKVRFMKPGYAPAESPELPVPPPQYNVNVGMTSYEAPQISSVLAAPGGAYVEISFTKPMLMNPLTDGALTVTDEVYGDTQNASPVFGTVTAIDGGTTVDGLEAADTIRFVPDPDAPLAVGHTYKLAWSALAVDYAGVALASGSPGILTVPGEDSVAPDEASHVDTVPGLADLLVTWQDPTAQDLDQLTLTWQPADRSGSMSSMTVKRGAEWADVAGLTPGTSYRLTLTAADRSGNTSAGVTWTAATSGSATPSAVANVSPVSNVLTAPDRDQIALTWSDPADSNLDKIEVSWHEQGDDSTGQSAIVDKGVQSFAVTGLKSDTVYVVSLIAITTDLDVSDPVQLTVRTTGSNSSEGHNSGATEKTENPNHTQVGVGEDAGKASAFDQALELSYEIGAFTEGTSIDLVRQPEDELQAEANLIALSDSFTITLRGEGAAQLNKPITLSLAYHATGLQPRDARKLGIYRQDPDHPSRWIYVGGLLDVQGHRIATAIDRFGTYAVFLYDKSFKDLSGHWSKEAVEVLVSRHILHGVDDSRFEPNRPMTRAELATMLVNVLDGGNGVSAVKSAQQTFSDVPVNAWYAPYVQKAKELGLIAGYDGKFRPLDEVTREEMMVMLLRAFITQADQDQPTDRLHNFKDAANISVWANSAINYALQKGYISGYGDDTLKPHKGATRAEVASVLFRILMETGKIVMP